MTNNREQTAFGWAVSALLAFPVAGLLMAVPVLVFGGVGGTEGVILGVAVPLLCEAVATVATHRYLLG